MSDVERDPVVAEVMRLMKDAPHGTYTAIAKLAGLKAPESVRQWALGHNRPPKKRWPAIEAHYDLKPGHFARIADEAPPVVVDRPGATVEVSLAQHLQLVHQVDELAARVEDLGAELERWKRGGGRGAR